VRESDTVWDSNLLNLLCFPESFIVQFESVRSVTAASLMVCGTLGLVSYFESVMKICNKPVSLARCSLYTPRVASAPIEKYHV
jgi:hypothetical protein